MFQVRDWLFISGFPAASNEQKVRSNNIDSMLLLYEPVRFKGIQDLYLNVIDGKPIAHDFIRKGVEFVVSEQAKGRKVLVSCGAGISRSVTFSVAALKEIEGISLEEAYLSIRKHHPEALPDHVQWDSLREYYGEGVEFWKIWQNVILNDEDD